MHCEDNIHAFVRDINTRVGTIRLQAMSIFVEYVTKYAPGDSLVLHTVALRDSIEKGPKHSNLKNYPAWEMGEE